MMPIPDGTRFPPPHARTMRAFPIAILTHDLERHRPALAHALRVDGSAHVLAHLEETKDKFEIGDRGDIHT